MKNVLMSALAGALMLGAASVANAESPIDFGVQLEQKVDQLQAAYDAKKPTKPYFVDLGSLVDQWGDADEITRKRLKRAMDDLMVRCERAKMQMADTMRLKAMIIDARLDRDLRLLWKQAMKRGATRADFERVAELLRHRAEVAKQPDDISQRVNNAMLDLMKKAKEGGTLTTLEMSTFEDDLMKVRLDRALAWLEEMAVARNASREQFLYVKDLMMDRARIWQEDVEFQNAVNHVLRELDQLMDRALQAGLNRSEIQRLRDMCMCRARNAVTSSAG